MSQFVGLNSWVENILSIYYGENMLADIKGIVPAVLLEMPNGIIYINLKCLMRAQ